MSNPAREWVSRAIEQGASVVTANKMLLAAHGPELLRAGRARGSRSFDSRRLSPAACR